LKTSKFDEPKRVEKPWGYELWWAQADRYVGKILHVNAGQRLSLQYHERKDETIHLWRGEALMVLDEGSGLQEHRMHAGDSYRVRPLTRHRLVAVTDCDFLEASTPEVEDVVRVDDEYGRAKK